MNKIWQCLSALLKPVLNDEMEFACKECGTKFFKKFSLETHEGFCWKLSAEDRETRAKSSYERVEEIEKQKKLDEIGDEKKDRGRSKTPKKKKEAIVNQKRSTTQQSPQKRKSGAVQNLQTQNPRISQINL